MTAITHLRLTNYRNYDALDLALDGRHVCLYGPNGAGKTNLLEAVSQLGPGRSLRGAALPEIARTGSLAWTVSADLDGTRKVGVALEGTKRLVRIEGANATAGDLADLMRIVWLVPAMDRVFAGGASERRRFYDRQVMAHRPAHGRVTAAYEKAMRDRNLLLEQARVDPAWADAIEARMAEYGAEIMLNRAAVLSELQSAVEARPEGYFPKADLALVGDASMVCDPGAMPGALAETLAEAFRTGRWRDKGVGRALSGPHRADLSVIHRPTGAPAEQASTGQQKALLIGLILATARALSDRMDGPTPLVLLDEAAAHLDADRRAALFDELSDLGGQAWLSGTEAFLFEAFGDRAVMVEVRDGQASLAKG